MINRSKMILALAGLALAAQVVAVDAHAQSARRKCVNKDSNTAGGAVAGAIIGGVAGALLGGKDKNIAIGAGIGAVTGGAVAHADGSDACREVEMDRRDREEDRRDSERDRLDPNSNYQPGSPSGGYEPDRYDRDDLRDRRGDRRGPRGGGVVVVPEHIFEQNFLRYYRNAYSDEQRIQQVSQLASDLQYRREMIDGTALYRVLALLNGGRAQRLSANRADALFMLSNSVVGLNYNESAWIDGLFPNKRHSAYPEVARTLRRLSF